MVSFGLLMKFSSGGVSRHFWSGSKTHNRLSSRPSTVKVSVPLAGTTTDPHGFAAGQMGHRVPRSLPPSGCNRSGRRVLPHRLLSRRVANGAHKVGALRLITSAAEVVEIDVVLMGSGQQANCDVT